MLPPLTALAAAALAAVLALPAGANDLFVGPGQAFTQIQPALDAAQPGDRVFVAPGDYAVFDLTVPVEVRGSAVGPTRVLTFQSGDRTTVSGIPAGATATIADIQFEFTSPEVVTDHPLLSVLDCPGTVVLQGVQVNLGSTTYHFGPGLFVADTGRLLVQQCFVRGHPGGTQFGGLGEPAVEAERSSLWISDSTLQATDATPGEFTSGEEGAPALRLTDGELHLARVAAEGGSGSYDVFLLEPSAGGPAVDLVGSTLVLAGGPDNQLLGGPGQFDAVAPAPGGPGLRLAGGSTAVVAADAVLTGGPGALGGPAGPPLVVEPGSSAQALAAALPVLRLTPDAAPVGGGFTLRFSGEPGAVVVAAVTGDLGPALSLGAAGVVHLALAAPKFLAPIALDGQGLGQRALAVPASPALAGAQAWFQAAQLAGLDLTVSNPARLAIAP